LKKTLVVSSIVLTAVTYLYLIVTTARGSGIGLSVTTFSLWSILAWITSFTMLKQKADPTVPLIYAVGATTTAIILVVKGRYDWSLLDLIVAILVIACIAVWITRGPRGALILSVIAGLTAAIPFIVVTWKAPMNSPLAVNAVLLFANFLAFVGAKAWTLEDRLYAVANMVLCIALVLPCVSL
jgi:hypothetical protein